MATTKTPLVARIGNFRKRERTNASMRGSPLLPAGLLAGLARVRYRISDIVAPIPLLFILVVVGIAVVFRIVIGPAHPASTHETNDAVPFVNIGHQFPQRDSPFRKAVDRRQ